MNAPAASPVARHRCAEIVLPALGLVLAGIVVGLLINALRPRDGLELSRSYFGAAPISSRASDLAERAAAEFSLLEADEVLRLVELWRADPTQVQLIDARSEAAYQKDHIPGACLIDYFNLPRDIAPALPFLRTLPLLLVYCESIECEDGFRLCQALRDDYGFARERLRLYVGGMRDWRERQLPRARGLLPW